MIHPDTELRFINSQKGYGVVATKLIPRGTITWVHDDLDQVFTKAMVQKMNPEIHRHLDHYAFTDNRGNRVLCWDNAKFVNHSFKSSCFSTAYNFEFAVRDIHPGEELTDDYGYLNIDEPFYALDEGTERTVVYPDDILNHATEWDQLIAAIAPLVLEVSQPMLSLLPNATWEEFKRDTHNSTLRSIKECHYHRQLNGFAGNDLDQAV